MTQTANTEQELQEFLDQVAHLIADGTIETRSLKRAGISFACGNLHAAFLAWQAARRAPTQPQWPQFEKCQDAFDSAKNRYPQGNPLGGDHEWHWFQAGWKSAQKD